MARFQAKTLDKGNDLLIYFRQHSGKIHESRRIFLVLMVLSLLSAASVSSHRLAADFPNTVLGSSNQKRIERFFRNCLLDYQAVATLIIGMLGLSGKLKLVLDRTDWMLGSTPINILTLAVVYEGSTTIPLLFRLLPHKGCSSQAVRIELIELFIRIFGENRIEWLTADREFIGKEWFIFLKEHDIPFYIRIKQNQYITDSKGKDSQPSF